MESEDLGKSRSRFRFLVGQTKKFGYSLRVKIGGGNSCLVRANPKYFAVPWDAPGGCLGILPYLPNSSSIEQRAINPLLIDAHTQDILAFDFHPFEEKIISTGSRDSTIKIWKIPSDEEWIRKETKISTPIASLQGHEKRITSILYHPVASNIIMSSGGDGAIKLWDIETSTCQITLGDNTGAVDSLCWSENGTLIATAYKQRLKLYDPRSKQSLVQDVLASNSPKPLQICFMGSEKIITIGFNKDNRELGVWSIKKGFEMSQLEVISVGTSSSPLFPYVESGTHLLYLAGKEDAIQFFEVFDEAPHLMYLNKVQTSSRLDLCIFPKRICDVTKCEITRFLSLSSANTIEEISFRAIRKNNTLFQEDLYPPMPAGKAALTSTEWFKGVNKEPVLFKLRPEGMTSVYEVSEEEGGRSRTKDVARSIGKSANVSLKTNGYIQFEVQGYFWDSWEKRWLSLSNSNKSLFFFKDENSPLSLLEIPLEKIEDIVPDSLNEVDFFIVIKSGNGILNYKLKAESGTEREEWISSLKDHKSKYLANLQIEAKKTEQVQKESKNKSEISLTQEEEPKKEGKKIEKEKNEEDDIFEGYLKIFQNGYIWNAWALIAARVIESEGLLILSPSFTSPIQERIHLDKVSGVFATKNFDNQPYTFQIVTPIKVFHLKANSEEEKTTWVQHLERIRKKLSGQFQDEDEEDTEIEGEEKNEKALRGFAEIKFGKIGFWYQYWITAVGFHLSYFRTPLDSIPVKSISLKHVKQVQDSPTNPSIFQINTVEVGLLQFRFLSSNEKELWKEGISKLLSNAPSNLLPTLNLDKIPETIEKYPNVNFLDFSLLKTGKQVLLVQVSGRRPPYVQLVKPALESLNQYCSYVLDAGMKIYIWNGSKANRIIRAKSVDISAKIRTKERGGNAKSIIVDEKKEEEPEFFRLLGGSGVKSLSPQGNELTEPLRVQIYKVSADSIYLIHNGKICSHKKLNDNHAYVIDSGTEIYYWCGKNCSRILKQLASKLAKKLALERSSWVMVCKMIENGETTIFKEKFSDYPGMLPIRTELAEKKGNVAKTQIQEKIDVKALHDIKPPSVLLAPLPAESSLKIFRIEGYEKENFPESYYGQFWSGDCFLILFTFMVQNTEKKTIFFWQGRDSSVVIQKYTNLDILFFELTIFKNEKGTSAFLTKEMNDEIQNEGLQIRVVQNQEPVEFLQLFGNYYIVHQGKFNQHSSKSIQFFNISGTNPAECRAIELQCSKENLNTRHCFLILNKSLSKIFIWKGKLCNNLEQKYAEKVSQVLNEKVGFEEVIVEEGKETVEFWKENQMDENQAYFDSKETRPECRLFNFNIGTGTVKAEPIFVVRQDNFDPRAVMMLDAVYEVFLWIGDKSSPSEQRIAFETALRYVKNSPRHPHSSTTPIWVVKQSQEPLSLRSNVLGGWSTTKAPIKSVTLQSLEEVLAEFEKKTYTYEELLQETLPKGVDQSKLEEYLSEEEFQSLFQMPRSQFQKLPSWKRDQLKKNVMLF